MNEYFPWMIAVAGVAASYCTFRWGHAEGLEDGRSKALRESGGFVSPSAVGGPGAVPR